MLVAAKVDPENPWRAATVINEHPGVSHNYLRNHEFNIWFTIATEPDSPLGLDRTLEVLGEIALFVVGGAVTAVVHALAEDPLWAQHPVERRWRRRT